MARINVRTKGNTAEREISNKILESLGVKLKRNLMQTMEGGHDLLVDVPLSTASPVLVNLFIHMAIEVKRYKKATQGVKRGWWRQTVDQAGRNDQSPVLVYRLDQCQWRFIIPLWFVQSNELDHGSRYSTEENTCFDETVEMSYDCFIGLMKQRESNHIVVEPIKKVKRRRRSILT